MDEHMAGMMGDSDVWSVLGFDMVLVDSSSTIVADTSNSRIGQQLSSATLTAGTQVIVNGEPVGTLLVILPDAGAVQSNEFLTEVRRGVWVAALAAGAVALIMGTLIFQRMIRPLRDLQKAAHRVAQGDLTARVDDIAGDEIGEVGLAFNRMAQNLSDQQTLRKQMVADIAHELRNPISVMQGTLEAMQDGLITPDPGEIQELHSDVRRLARLVEDLRTLSLADAGQLTLLLERINPVVLAEHVVSRMGAIAAERGVSLTLEALPNTSEVDADEDRLAQVLGNLVDNALRHTPRGGHVQVRVAEQPGEVRVEVADDGPGIAAGDLPYVFERFWRGDKSRSRDSGGSGLGLAIVRQLTELHGGRVSVDSAPGRGATFRVILPALSA
jgi:signal transduction histidine kinase